MPKLSLIQRNLQAEVDGVWLPFDLVPGIRFKVARAQNAKYRARLEQLVEPIRGAWQAGEVTDDKRREILARAAADTLLNDWEGVEDESGDALPFSREAAFMILNDPSYADVLNWIFARATEADHFLVRAREQALGNSSRSSGGGSATEQPTTSSSAA